MATEQNKRRKFAVAGQYAASVIAEDSALGGEQTPREPQQRQQLQQQHRAASAPVRVSVATSLPGATTRKSAQIADAAAAAAAGVRQEYDAGRGSTRANLCCCQLDWCKNLKQTVGEVALTSHSLTVAGDVDARLVWLNRLCPSAEPDAKTLMATAPVGCYRVHTSHFAPRDKRWTEGGTPQLRLVSDAQPTGIHRAVSSVPRERGAPLDEVFHHPVRTPAAGNAYTLNAVSGGGSITRRRGRFPSTPPGEGAAPRLLLPSLETPDNEPAGRDSAASPAAGNMLLDSDDEDTMPPAQTVIPPSPQLRAENERLTGEVERLRARLARNGLTSASDDDSVDEDAESAAALRLVMARVPIDDPGLPRSDEDDSSDDPDYHDYSDDDFEDDSDDDLVGDQQPVLSFAVMCEDSADPDIRKNCKQLTGFASAEAFVATWKLVNWNGEARRAYFISAASEVTESISALLGHVTVLTARTWMVPGLILRCCRENAAVEWSTVCDGSGET